jgi:hypothetical protein
MLTTRELLIARNQVIREIDTIFSDIIRTLENQTVVAEDEPNESFDKIYPLSFNFAEFKGKKPTSLHFGREIVPVYSWKKVFAKIMERCNSDVDKHKALMDLRSKISGRSRLILSDRPEGMRAPLEIAHKLYAETHYDTGNLLHILTRRLLDPVGYDYSNIYVAVRTER